MSLQTKQDTDNNTLPSDTNINCRSELSAIYCPRLLDLKQKLSKKSTKIFRKNKIMQLKLKCDLKKYSILKSDSYFPKIKDTIKSNLISNSDKNKYLDFISISKEIQNYYLISKKNPKIFKKIEDVNFLNLIERDQVYEVSEKSRNESEMFLFYKHMEVQSFCNNTRFQNIKYCAPDDVIDTIPATHKSTSAEGPVSSNNRLVLKFCRNSKIVSLTKFYTYFTKNDKSFLERICDLRLGRYFLKREY